MNDIDDTVRDATVELLQQFEQQQKEALVTIQMGLCELQIYATQVQTNVGQGSAASRSLVPQTSNAAEMVCSMDPQAFAQLDGALTAEIEVDRAIFSALKKCRLNLAVLRSEVLHTLQDGLITELRARE